MAPGILQRALALIARIKTAPGYTDSIGRALGLIGPAAAAPQANAVSLKPVLSVVQIGSAVLVKCKKEGMDAIEYHADHGDGKGLVFLALSTLHDYTDHTPLPAAGQSAVWKYTAIYQKAGEQAGQWSNVVTLAVKGV